MEDRENITNQKIKKRDNMMIKFMPKRCAYTTVIDFYEGQKQL